MPNTSPNDSASPPKPDFQRLLAQVRQAMDFATWSVMPPPPGALAFAGTVDDELVKMTSGGICHYAGRTFDFEQKDLVGWTFVVVQFESVRGKHYDGAATHGPTLTIVHLTEDLAKYAFEAAFETVNVAALDGT